MFAGLLAGGVCVSGASARTSEPFFDKPLKVVHVTLPLDKDNPQSKPEVRCSYYPEFMVKEIDLGEEGDFQLSILSGKDPVCRKENAPNEKIVSPDDWTGYFDGVFRNYVFFSAEDGWNGGLGFAVFTPGAKKLFDDVAKKWEMIATTGLPPPAGIAGNGLALRYIRVYGAKCSLAAANGDTCWTKIKNDTGLQGAAPDCKALYAREQKRTPKVAKEILDDPTAIEYDVATTLAMNGVHMVALPNSAPVCGPQD
jgi:hypothetical protein